MPPRREKHPIPPALQDVDEEIREDAKACYLAEILTKKQFQKEYRNYMDIGCNAVINEVANRVSSQHPQPEDAIPWYLAKNLIKGTLKLRIYTLDHGIAKIERFLKASTEDPDLQKMKEPWNLPAISLEPPSVIAPVFGPHLPHIAPTDIFQIDEVDKISVSTSNALDFGPLSTEDLEIYTSNDWMAAIQKQEERLRQGKSQSCIAPSTSKRKAPAAGDHDSPPPVTPSKRSRLRDLNEQIGISEPPSLAETRSEPAIEPEGFSNAVPLPDIYLAAQDENGEPIAPEQVHIEALPEPQEISIPHAGSPLPPRPPQPRGQRRKPIQVAARTLINRVTNIHIDTVPIADLQIDINQAQNDALVLFREPASTWLNNGRVPRNRVLVEHYADALRVDPNDEEVDFPPTDNHTWLRIQNILQGVNVRAAPSNRRVLLSEVPEGSHATESDIPEVFTDADQERLLLPDSVDMDLPETYRPSEGPENAVAQEPVVLEDYTFVPSEIGSSRAGQTSQSTISEDNSEAYTHVIGMSKKEFRAALTAKWTENRNLKNGPDVFRATFDEVVVPASVSRLDYVLALSYAMDGMMKGELLMEQSAPFAPISLSTYPS